MAIVDKLTQEDRVIVNKYCALRNFGGKWNFSQEAAS